MVVTALLRAWEVRGGAGSGGGEGVWNKGRRLKERSTGDLNERDLACASSAPASQGSQAYSSAPSRIGTLGVLCVLCVSFMRRVVHLSL